MRRSKLTPIFFILPALALIVFMSIFPLAYSLYYSFYNYRIFSAAQPVFVGLDNYIFFFTDPIVMNSARVTLIFMACGLGLQAPLGLAIALLLNSNLKGRNILKIIVEIPMVLTPMVIGILFRMICQPTLGQLNQILRFFGLPGQDWLGDRTLALFSVIIVDSWQWTPFVVLITLAALHSIPKEYYEAAKIDGASSTQILRWITIPLIRNALLIAVLLRAIDMARIFDKVFILTRGGPVLGTDFFTVMLHRIGLKFGHLSYACAASFIYVLIASVLIYFFIKISKIRV